MTDRILIINQNWLGDVLFSTPAIRALRKRFPAAHIACLVPPRCKEVLQNNPHLNEVMVYDDRAPLFSAQTLGLVAALKKRAFERAILFHRSGSKATFAFLAGIPERCGYVAERRRFLTHPVPEPPPGLHKIDFFLNLLAGLGIPADGRVPDFFPGTEAEKEFAALFQQNGLTEGRYVVAHAGGNWALKRWPAGHFIRWIRLFLETSELKVVLCGTASEQDLSETLLSELDRSRVVSLCGKTSLGALALLLKKSRFLVSNDSGPIHLAASQGTPIVGIFGPTSPSLTGPVSAGPVRILKKDVGCELPCYFRNCDYRVCMEWILPEEVLEEAKRLLGSN